jgi:hypothetical protein
LECVFEAIELSDALDSEQAKNKQLEDIANGKTVTLMGWAQFWWSLFSPSSGLLAQFDKNSIILDGVKKASRTRKQAVQRRRLSRFSVPVMSGQKNSRRQDRMTSRVPLRLGRRCISSTRLFSASKKI